MPSATDPSVSFIFKRPFAEQVAFFRGKLGNLVPTRTWRDMQRAAHDRGFMVAGAGKADLLADLAGAIDKATADGETIQQFRARFRDIVRTHGWHGWTGEGTKAGEAWRTRIIYETNLSTSYAAGRLAQLRAGQYPFWMYKHSDAVQRPRPQHLAWNGLVLPPDHEFWSTHSPPNGWGCKCRIVGVRSPAQARRLGGDPDKDLPRGWNDRDSTGRLPGIDEGWDYQPGASVGHTVQTVAKKTVQWDYRLAKAYMEEIPSQQRDALATAIRRQPETGEAVRRYARRVLEKIEADVPPYQTMGLLTTEEATRIAEITGVTAVQTQLYDYTLDANAVLHVHGGHGDEDEEARRYEQRAISPADFSRLPQLLSVTPVFAGRGKKTGQPQVRFVKKIGAELFTALFEVRSQRRMLALKTFYIGTERKTESP